MADHLSFVVLKFSTVSRGPNVKYIWHLMRPEWKFLGSKNNLILIKAISYSVDNKNFDRWTKFIMLVLCSIS